MVRRNRRKRRFSIRVLAPAGAVVLLLLILLPRPTSGSHVEPIYVGNSASSNDLAPTGTIWNQMEISTVEDGTYLHGPLTVTLDVNSSGNGTTINWSSNLDVDGVFVKGGPGGNFYHYVPPETADSSLSAPPNPGNGGPYNPGHMLFCTTTSLEPSEPTPTPPQPETPTPSATATLAATPTATLTPTPTASGTLSPTLTFTPSPTATATVSPTLTVTPTPTATAITGTATSEPGHVGHLFIPAVCIDCYNVLGEPNNTCGSAHPILTDTLYEYYPDDKDDWYIFRLEVEAELTIRLQNFMPRAGQLAAYNGNSCGSAHFLGNYGDESLEKILDLGRQPAGNYYLYVSNDGLMSSTDPYRLIVVTR